MFNGSTGNDDPDGYDWYTNGVFDSNGSFTGTTSTVVDSTTYSGVWIQLKMPYEMIISSIDIGGTSGRKDQAAAKIVLVGSNDGGTTFEYIYHNTSDYLNSSISFQDLLNVPIPGITKAYSTYRMIVTNIGVSGSHSSVLAMDYWNLNGTIEAPFVGNTVTVSGDPAVFYLDNSANPQLTFTAGETYVFDQSHTSNAGYQIVFGRTPDDPVLFTEGVTIMGTPGQPGAYTQVDLSDGFTGDLFYYNTTTPGMGYII